MARTAVIAATSLLLTACARMGPPPGAPPDFTAPVLLGTVPESIMVLPDFDGWAEFRFDEVIDEGGQPNFGFGTGMLERLVTISPDSGVPRVRWKRDRIEVQPRRGWRPNVVYRIELGSGLADLRGNRNDTARVITFTTGAPLPTRWLEGSAVDWSARRFAPRTAIQALLLPDSLLYRGTTDSTGHFSLGPLPDGQYLVTALADANSNGRRDAREAWDTVRTMAGGGPIGEIWTFVRDTTGPRLEQNGTTRADSFAIALAFNQPLDPDLDIPAAAISVNRVADSTALPVLSGWPQPRHDSIYTPIDSARRAIAAAAARDSIARATRDSLLAAGVPDTAAAQPEPVAADSVPPPAQVRPAEPARADTTGPRQDRRRISNRLLIRLGTSLESGQRYDIEVRGIRALGGAVTDTLRTRLEIPAAAPTRTP
ncbi:MAG TPA: hypothetical protein PLL69_08815 [Gemmatimonadales bacterium]|nr:hypothetical protein [Gemmatimonadales bacterium]